MWQQRDRAVPKRRLRGGAHSDRPVACMWRIHMQAQQEGRPPGTRLEQNGGTQRETAPWRPAWMLSDLRASARVCNEGEVGDCDRCIALAGRNMSEV